MKELTQEEMREVNGGSVKDVIEVGKAWAKMVERHEKERKEARGDHKYERPSETGSDKHTEM
ncbi:MAG: hypothetical protein WBG30_14390 [Psychrilyobacter sp.]|uniref:hypothetical protein n=1 Tax=Psychrilyobacter sp. TaxID=2586924 RepID=UPI003C71420B